MMKRLKILGVLAVTVFVLGAVTVSVASAAAMKNPEFTVTTNGTGTSSAATFFGAAEIKCKSGTGTGTAINKKEGTGTGDFKECSLFNEECHSLGDAGGVILGGGITRLVLGDVSGKDQRLALGEGKELHIECKFLSTLVIVRGSVLGSIEAKAGTKNEFIVKVKAKGAKEQEFTEYLNEKEEAVKVHLESSTNEGTFSESAEEAGEGIVKTEKNTELIN